MMKPKILKNSTKIASNVSLDKTRHAISDHNSDPRFESIVRKALVQVSYREKSVINICNSIVDLCNDHWLLIGSIVISLIAVMAVMFVKKKLNDLSRKLDLEVVGKCIYAEELNLRTDQDDQHSSQVLETVWAPDLFASMLDMDQVYESCLIQWAQQPDLAQQDILDNKDIYGDDEVKKCDLIDTQESGDNPESVTESCLNVKKPLQIETIIRDTVVDESKDQGKYSPFVKKCIQTLNETQRSDTSETHSVDSIYSNGCRTNRLPSVKSYRQRFCCDRRRSDRSKKVAKTANELYIMGVIATTATIFYKIQFN